MNDSLEGSMGVGLSFNTAAAQALSLLSGVGRVLPAEQSRPTGLKVEQASDNKAYWSIATTMQADGLSLSSADEATSRASAIVDTASVGITQATTILGDIRSGLVAAKRPGSDRGEIGVRLEALKNELVAVADDSGFDGENWLSLPSGQSPNVEAVVASVSRNGGALSVNVIDFDTAVSALVSRNNADDGLLTRSHAVTNAQGGSSDYVMLEVGTVGAGEQARPITLTATTSNDEIEEMIAAVDLIAGYLMAAATSLEVTRVQIVHDIGLYDVHGSAFATFGDLEDDLRGDGSVELALKVRDQLRAQALPIANSGEGSSKLFL